MNKTNNEISVWLWLLTFIFIFRVVGQLLAQWFEIPFLPSFDHWYSGALAYPYLLGFQFLIIAVMSLVSFRVDKGLLLPHRKTGVFLQVIGWFYFSVMFVRWVIGVFEMVDITWFQRPIPAFFHMILASYILLVAHYHKSISVKDE